LAEWRTEHGTLTNLYQTPIFTNIRMSNVLGVKRENINYRTRTLGQIGVLRIASGQLVLRVTNT